MPVASPEWSRDRWRLILGVSALVLAGVVAFAFKVSERMPDFEVYWRAATRAAAAESLYRPEDGHWLFKYLPAFAILVMPIALLPLQVAKALWFATTIAGLVLLLNTSLRLLPEVRKPRWLLIVATIVVMGKFYAHELELGQTNLLLAAVATAAFLSIKRGREALAGALVVGAIVLKPYAAILLPWLLARGRRASIASATIGSVVVIALPVAGYGFGPTVQLYKDWWYTVVTSTGPNLLLAENVSWLSMYSRWLQPGQLAESLTVATGFAVLAVVLYVYSRRQPLAFPELLEGSLLLILMPLISPQGWDYALLVATPGVMCLVNYEDRLPSVFRPVTIVALAAIGLSVYDLVGRAAYLTFMNLSGITAASFVVIAALAALRRQQVA